MLHCLRSEKGSLSTATALLVGQRKVAKGQQRQFQPRRAASIAATSIFLISIIASNARFA